MKTTLTRRQLIGGTLLGPALWAGAGCRPSASRDGRTTIRYMAWGNPEQLALEKRIIGEFEKRRPDIHVHLFMVPSSAYADKLQLMLASRTAPDVMRADHYYFPALANRDYFLPLDPFLAQEEPGFTADFLPLALEEGRWKDRLYGMNVLFGPLMVYYNKKMFTAAGLPDPYDRYRRGDWNWDAFVEAAQVLTRRENGRTTQFGAEMVGFPLYAPVVWNFGGDFMDRGRTRLTIADDPAAIRGLEAYADLRWKYRCAPTPADSALSAFTFESGKIAMHWGWAGDTPRFRKTIRSFDWDIVPTPSGPKGNATVIKGNQLTIYRETEYPRESWEFVKFMTGPEVEMLLCGKLRRSVPTRLSVQNDPRYLQTDQPPYHTDVYLDSVRRGRTLPIDARYQEWSQEFYAATDNLFNIGTETARTAASTAARQVNAVLAGEEGF